MVSQQRKRCFWYEIVFLHALACVLRKDATKQRKNVEFASAKKLAFRGRSMLKRPSAAANVKKTIHKARHIVFRVRNVKGEESSKKYAVLPLPPKVAAKGHAAGAESFLETVLKVQSKLDKSKHVAAADGSPALQQAAAAANVVSLKGVSHLRFIFTPLPVIPKKGLDQNSINLFRRLVGDEVCKERRDSFVLTAGDNCAESLCAVSKKQLRRTNLNIAVVRDKIEHRYLLSSHFLNKAPGLARIMQALRCHKMKCMSGLVSPTDAFKKPLWQLWLTCSEKKKGWLSCC